MVQISVAYPTGLSPQNTVFGVTVSTATAGTQRDRPMLALPRNNIFDLRTSISRGYCQWSLEWSSSGVFVRLLKFIGLHGSGAWPPETESHVLSDCPAALMNQPRVRLRLESTCCRAGVVFWRQFPGCYCGLGHTPSRCENTGCVSLYVFPCFYLICVCKVCWHFPACYKHPSRGRRSRAHLRVPSFFRPQ